MRYNGRSTQGILNAEILEDNFAVIINILGFRIDEVTSTYYRQYVKHQQRCDWSSQGCGFVKGFKGPRWCFIEGLFNSRGQTAVPHLLWTSWKRAVSCACWNSWENPFVDNCSCEKDQSKGINSRTGISKSPWLSSTEQGMCIHSLFLAAFFTWGHLVTGINRQVYIQHIHSQFLSSSTVEVCIQQFTDLVALN